jgi:hypothetical protein
MALYSEAFKQANHLKPLFLLKIFPSPTDHKENRNESGVAVTTPPLNNSSLWIIPSSKSAPSEMLAKAWLGHATVSPIRSGGKKRPPIWFEPFFGKQTTLLPASSITVAELDV